MISGPTELRAQRISRLGELADVLAPTASSAALGSAGIVAKTYRVATEFESMPFSLEYAAVLIVHRGTLGLRLTLADLDRTLGMGGLAVIPAATPLSLQLANADITACYLAPDQIPHMPMEQVSSLEIAPRIDPRDVQLGFIMNTIRDEVQAGNPLGKLYLESLGLGLTVRLFGCYARKAPAAVPYRGGLTNRHLRQAKNAILSDLDKSVPLSSLAREAHLSTSHFSKAFKKSTGLSPQKWRLDRRFALARQMIAEEGKTITSIALSLGYASLSQFSTAFKRATGLSPSRYRRKGP